MSISYDLVSSSDIEAAHAIESAGYPPDEAASLQAFRYRQEQAPDLFLGAYLTGKDNRTLVGYVCSTLSPSPTLTHESMSTHIPASRSVCIHSVCVALPHRRRGIATGLLKEYVSRLEQARADGSPYEQILLITHEELRPLYEKAGFEFLGPSKVIHGSRPWFDMRRILSTPPARTIPSLLSSTSAQAIPDSLWEALSGSSSSSRKPRVGHKLDSFPNGIADVSELEDASGDAFNKYDLLCPREGCGSIILKNKVATLVDKESLQLEPSENLNPFLDPLPAANTLFPWWKIMPNAMAFENIGFSRPVGDRVSPSGKKLKFLLCAECDLGPLGWCEEGGSEFWIASNRVAYRPVA